MRRMLLWMPILLASILVFAQPSDVMAKEPEHADVRVLIDISGSMKKNDPKNLRRPALRMLVGLMQQGTHASVWTFAKWNNMLVKQGPANEPWKKKALSLSRTISSPGLFTNIEDVLINASKDWKGPPEDFHRHLVVLTDGMVDVSKVPGESEASRKRIISDLIPKLKQTGAKIHAIALSDNADHELMKLLSAETNGWYEKIDSADQLQRVFLKIFEKVGKPDSVPLNDNKFTVDGTINEATVLLFKKEDSPDTVLISPDGKEYTDGDIIAGVAWYRDQGYELITVSSPMKGEWSLRADIDPDNRVMIVTDLKLVTSEIPSNLAVGEKVSVTAHLANRGKVVKRKAFLRLVDVRADAMTPAGSDPQPLNDNGEHGDKSAADGSYGMTYSEPRLFEEVELLVSVESATFMREKRHVIALHEPASLKFEGEGDDVTAVASVSEAVMQQGAELKLWNQEEGGEKTAVSFKADESNPYRFQVDLVDPAKPLYMSVEGLSRSANAVQRDYGPLYAPGKEPEKPQEPVGEPASEEAPAEEAKEEVEEEVVEEDDSFLMSALVIGGANLILIGGLAAWWIIRKKKAANQVSLIDEDEDLLDEDDEDGIEGDTDEDDLGEDIQGDDDSDEVPEEADQEDSDDAKK